LTYARTLEIRPSSSTRKYASGEGDPAKIGRELQVSTVVTGHFLEQNKEVMVTLEAVEVKDNKLIWTGTLMAPSDNLIALQNQLAKKVRQELLPALGVAGGAMEASSAPANSEGYDWYLRSVPVSRDAAPNKEAITMLERAVALDPNYAPAWEALGRRYYFDAIYGEAERRSSALEPACRGLKLEPGASVRGILTTGSGDGRLDKAYRDARDLWQASGQRVCSFSLAYVCDIAKWTRQREYAAAAIDQEASTEVVCVCTFFRGRKRCSRNGM
jgi:hypothetical protein